MDSRSLIGVRDKLRGSDVIFDFLRSHQEWVRLFIDSDAIQRTPDSFPPFIKDMGIDHGGAHIHVSEQFLDSADIISSLQQMRCKAVPKGMATDGFFYSSQACSIFDRLLKAAFILTLSKWLFRPGFTFSGKTVTLSLAPFPSRTII